MNNVNVYDIATSEWYTQATAGSTPDIRVNPCAVVAAAPDGTSYNVYMWVSNDKESTRTPEQLNSDRTNREGKI